LLRAWLQQRVGVICLQGEHWRHIRQRTDGAARRDRLGN
jgi:hypothetical protein